MKIVRYEDPAEFLDRANEFLCRDEARHSLMLSLASGLIDRPDVYPEYDLRLVEVDDELVAASLRTPPHNLVISAPSVAGALEVLANGLAAEGTVLPGVVAGLPEADVFAEAWADATGASIGKRMDQAIHILDEVDEVPVPPGAPRRAGPDDLELVLAWTRAFSAEAGAAEVRDEDQARRNLTHRLVQGGPSGARLWEDGVPVCLVGFNGTPGQSARIGPVYTPLEHRRHGYATALTAHVSREMLERGLRSCHLYTDLANPTSNAIYRRVGYVRACDSAMISFVAPEAE